MDLKLCDRKVQGCEIVWSQSAGLWNCVIAKCRAVKLCDFKVPGCENLWSQSVVPRNSVIAKCRVVKLCDRKVQGRETGLPLTTQLVRRHLPCILFYVILVYTHDFLYVCMYVSEYLCLGVEDARMGQKRYKNVKFSMRVSWWHGGELALYLHSFLISALEGRDWLVHAPCHFTPPGKSPSCLVYKRVCELQSRSGSFEEEPSVCTHRNWKCDSQVFQFRSSHYADWAIRWRIYEDHLKARGNCEFTFLT